MTMKPSCVRSQHLWLSVVGLVILAVCLNADSPPVCSKDCSTRAPVRVCGDNGQWYDNICYLRQSNCLPDPDGRHKVRKTTDTSVCGSQDAPVCAKDCSTRAPVRVCGDNGQWYDNICYLRQSNCFPDPDGRHKVRKTTDTSVCESQTTGIEGTATSAPSSSSI